MVTGHKERHQATIRTYSTSPVTSQHFYYHFLFILKKMLGKDHWSVLNHQMHLNKLCESHNKWIPSWVAWYTTGSGLGLTAFPPCFQPQPGVHADQPPSVHLERGLGCHRLRQPDSALGQRGVSENEAD